MESFSICLFDTLLSDVHCLVINTLAVNIVGRNAVSADDILGSNLNTDQNYIHIKPTWNSELATYYSNNIDTTEVLGIWDSIDQFIYENCPPI